MSNWGDSDDWVFIQATADDDERVEEVPANPPPADGDDLQRQPGDIQQPSGHANFDRI